MSLTLTAQRKRRGAKTGDDDGFPKSRFVVGESGDAGADYNSAEEADEYEEDGFVVADDAPEPGEEGLPTMLIPPVIACDACGYYIYTWDTHACPYYQSTYYVCHQCAQEITVHYCPFCQEDHTDMGYHSE